MLDEPGIERLLAWMVHDRDESRWYALLDGARDPRIVPALRGAGQESRCLFDGELHPALAAAAPYLVELDPAGPFARTLLRDGWGQAWGVFVVAPADIDQLRRHFRRFLRVTDESGRPLMFRYYDPRVLRVYLPTCTAQELEFVFGPVTRYIAESDDEPIALAMSVSAGELSQLSFDPRDGGP